MQEIPEAEKFWTKGPKNVDQLDILFKDNVVAGEGAWALSQGFTTNNEDVYDLCLGEEFDYNFEEGLDIFNHRFENVIDVDTPLTNTTHSVQKKGKKRKKESSKVGVGARVTQQFDALLDVITNKNNTYKSKDKPDCSIEEVMQVIDEIPEIVDDDELFFKATKLFTKRKNRKMFIAIKQHNW